MYFSWAEVVDVDVVVVVVDVVVVVVSRVSSEMAKSKSEDLIFNHFALR